MISTHQELWLAASSVSNAAIRGFDAVPPSRANRVPVQDAVYDAFAEQFARRMSKLEAGDGFMDGVHVGPLISEAGVRKIEQHIADAISKGARILVGGKRHALGGLFFEPTVLIDVSA